MIKSPDHMLAFTLQTANEQFVGALLDNIPLPLKIHTMSSSK